MSRHNPLEDVFLNENDIKHAKPVGASLKFCRLLTSQGSIYARFDKLHAWDIAVGHLLIKEAGYHIFDLTTQNEPCYLTIGKIESPYCFTPPLSITRNEIPCLN